MERSNKQYDDLPRVKGAPTLQNLHPLDELVLAAAYAASAPLFRDFDVEVSIAGEGSLVLREWSTETREVVPGLDLPWTAETAFEQAWESDFLDVVVFQRSGPVFCQKWLTDADDENEAMEVEDLSRDLARLGLLAKLHLAIAKLFKTGS